MALTYTEDHGDTPAPAPALLGEVRSDTISCRWPSVFTAVTCTCHRLTHMCVVLDLQLTYGPGHEQSINPLQTQMRAGWEETAAPAVPLTFPPSFSTEEADSSVNWLLCSC